MNKITLLLLITVNIITSQEIMIEVDNSVELDKSQEDYERISKNDNMRN